MTLGDIKSASFADDLRYAVSEEIIEKTLKAHKP